MRIVIFASEAFVNYLIFSIGWALDVLAIIDVWCDPDNTIYYKYRVYIV